MTTTLITGANKGLGFETARRLIAAGHTVHLGSRDAERGRAAARRLGATPLVIDITDDASVAARAVEAAGGLDVLVNNAAIAGPVTAVGEVTAGIMQPLYDTNVFGVARMMHAFLPPLEKSPAPVVINVSSGLGSMALTTDPESLACRVPALAYGSSKAAVNMLTVRYAQAYPGHADHLRRSRLHGDRPERPPGHPDGRGGCGDHRAYGAAGPGRPHRRVPGGLGSPALVIPTGPAGSGTD